MSHPYTLSCTKLSLLLSLSFVPIVTVFSKPCFYPFWLSWPRKGKPKHTKIFSTILLHFTRPSSSSSFAYVNLSTCHKKNYASLNFTFVIWHKRGYYKTTTLMTTNYKPTTLFPCKYIHFLYSPTYQAEKVHIKYTLV